MADEGPTQESLDEMNAMKYPGSRSRTGIVRGLFAGLVGTGAVMALRAFDQKYAPKTIPKIKEDPGEYIIHATEDATGQARQPKAVEKLSAIVTHLGYGSMFGILYGLIRGRGVDRSAIMDGCCLGTAAYSIGYLGWLPALGLSKPIWRQEFPEIAGEVFRHIAYGVATTAAYGMLDTDTRNH